MATGNFFKPTAVKIVLALILLLPALLLGPSYQEIRLCKTQDCGTVSNAYYQTGVFLTGILQVSSTFLYGLGVPRAQEVTFWMFLSVLAGGYYLVSCEVFLAYKSVLKTGIAHRKYLSMIKNEVYHENRVKCAKCRPLHEDKILNPGHIS